MKDIIKLLVHGTPIETYDVQGVVVRVKREDLCFKHPTLPSIAKIRALVPILLDYKARGIDKVAVYATRVSRVGWATAGLCSLLKMHCTYYYPEFIGQSNPDLLPVWAARLAGAKIQPIKVKGSTVCHYGDAADLADAAGERLLPYGLASRLAVDAYMDEAKTLPSEYVNGTLVGCSGSGTALMGVWMAVGPDTDVVGVQVGAETSWRACSKGKRPIRVVTSPHAYYNIAAVQAPFPCDAHYDAKAWEWLTLNIRQLRQPVLFYNLG